MNATNTKATTTQTQAERDAILAALQADAKARAAREGARFWR